MERRFNGGNILDENIDRTSNSAGTLSMANTGDPNTNGSQLFLNVADNSNLDWFSAGESRHPVFGQLVDKKSFDLCVKVSRVQTRDENPVRPIQVQSVTVDLRGFGAEAGAGAGAGVGAGAGARAEAGTGAGAAAGAGGTAGGTAGAGREYFYLDKSQQEQGPFSLAEMRAWWSGGHLPAQQQVRRDGETTGFRPLESHSAIVQTAPAAATAAGVGRGGGGAAARGSDRYAPY
jgi:hypothetical protein